MSNRHFLAENTRGRVKSSSMHLGKVEDYVAEGGAVTSIVDFEVSIEVPNTAVLSEQTRSQAVQMNCLKTMGSQRSVRKATVYEVRVSS